VRASRTAARQPRLLLRLPNDFDLSKRTRSTLWTCGGAARFRT